MKRIRPMGLALIALFAFGAFASSALAEQPEILPNPTAANPIEFSSEATGETKLISTKGKEIVCHKAKNKGSFTSARAGTVTIEFEECEVGPLGTNVTCTGVDNPGKPGVIITKGKTELVDILPTGTLDLGIWIEPKNAAGTKDVEFECGGVVKAIILGSVIGAVDNNKEPKAPTLLTPAEGAAGVSEVFVLWKQSATGEQEIKTCMTPEALCGKAEANKFSLLADFGKGHELTSEVADARLFAFTGTKVVIDF